MDAIRESIKIIFRKQNPEIIIQNHFKLKEKSSENLFKSIYSYENPLLYNKDEIENVCNLLDSNWKKLDQVKDKENELNILINFTENILKEEKGEPICKFEYLLKWRALSYELGEDILTTSYFAYKDYVEGKKREIFAWKPIVGTDNFRLKEILKKGIAENHFHLKGSAPHFQLMWISLMNNILNRDRDFKELEKGLLLEPNIGYYHNDEKLEIKSLVKKACCIRFRLFSLIKEIKIDEKKYIELLKSTEDPEINFYLTDLQEEIDITKYEYGKSFRDKVADYAIDKGINDNNYNKIKKEYNGNILLYGERKLLYTIFKRIYSGDKEIKKYQNLFKAYLIIKEKLRCEIIQVNNRVGFSNFGDYQARKSIFLDGIYREAVINMAINSSLIDQNIKFLEARIGPENSLEKLDKAIYEIDKSVENKKFYDLEDEKLKEFEKNILKKSMKTLEEKAYFYNIHFIKLPEKYKERKKNEKKNKYVGLLKPLNYQVRKNIEKQAKAIINLKKTTSKSKDRICGIDAANVEIGCRPEVFSQCFRYIRNYKIENEFGNFGYEENFTLGITYHAGEDFLDIVDGLRSIDETIRFLNYSQGDRLGHALALGINPEKYYKSKNMYLIKNKQVHLDDIVWILQKIKEYNLKNISENEVSKLEEEFYKLYYEVYFNNMDEKFQCNPYEYYNSWKLRGDNPKLYLDKYNIEKFEKINMLTFWDKCGLDFSRKEELNLVRKNKKSYELYREYHFNSDIKLKGLESEIVKISYSYIKIVEKLQEGLQKEIAKKNISIETNPTSNYVIGTFKKYIEHPIVKFFNLGLTYKEKELEKSQQLHVSINTDDQGVFPTYLENEYALIALALEKEKDENNEYIYNSTMIYDWIDRIRQMGLEQSFKSRNNNSKSEKNN